MSVIFTDSFLFTTKTSESFVLLRSRLKRIELLLFFKPAAAQPVRLHFSHIKHFLKTSTQLPENAFVTVGPAAFAKKEKKRSKVTSRCLSYLRNEISSSTVSFIVRPNSTTVVE